MAPQKTPAPNKNAKKKAAAKSGTKTPIKKSKVASPKTTLESKKKMIKNLDAKKGGVSAFDMEAFVKVKFSALEKTAHQKKVMLEICMFQLLVVAETGWTNQQHCGGPEQVQPEDGERGLQGGEGGEPRGHLARPSPARRPGCPRSN